MTKQKPTAEDLFRQLGVSNWDDFTVKAVAVMQDRLRASKEASDRRMAGAKDATAERRATLTHAFLAVATTDKMKLLVEKLISKAKDGNVESIKLLKQYV